MDGTLGKPQKSVSEKRTTEQHKVGLGLEAGKVNRPGEAVMVSVMHKG